MTPLEAKAQRGVSVVRRRQAEALCALDFLLWGDEQGVHQKRCVHRGTTTPVCSRDYHPGPVPDDTSLYEGSALGALWGLVGSPTLLASSWPGWNLKSRRRKDT